MNITISQLVSQLKHIWTWEGRPVERVEIICAGQMISLNVRKNGF